jgi:hypothetical protein
LLRHGAAVRQQAIFFDATITTAAYMEIFNTFVTQLNDEELLI